jgi:hypothetical protein
MTEYVIALGVGLINFALCMILLFTCAIHNQDIAKLDKQVNLLTQQTMSLLIKQGYEAEE